MTEGGDIGFRVYYKDPQDGVVDFIPLDRIESHLVTEEGEIICEKSGKCNSIHWNCLKKRRIFRPLNSWCMYILFLDVVTFDNTFSIVRPKKVRYYIVVEPPTNVSAAVSG